MFLTEKMVRSKRESDCLSNRGEISLDKALCLLLGTEVMNDAS